MIKSGRGNPHVVILRRESNSSQYSWTKKIQNVYFRWQLHILGLLNVLVSFINWRQLR